MKISYNWLKQYIHFDLTPETTAKYLTDCGLEVEGMEEFETVKGGLKGVVVGEVLTCENHPDSDHLHITTVNVGNDIPLNIVCGASNVAQGQKVVVATIGAILYHEQASFVIKKSKIRGVVSEGMICAEDEIGIGSSHNGIMVLDDNAQPGTPAADYFKVENDSIFEIGLTPNRSDAISHFGVARDLYAALKVNNIPCSPIIYPKAEDFIPTAKMSVVDIFLEDKNACPRYTGLTIQNAEVGESPDWLKNRLRSIGVRPINNVVDVAQYIMFEIGQPLHAFDADKIIGNKVIIKTLPEGTPFVTLDGHEVKLSSEDLMICNAEEGMCIAGVYGGLKSGVTSNTKNIFLESAYFNPVSIRKTSKRHNLKTDASFRYERGCDPEITKYALRRAVNLIQELTGATNISVITDIYPTEIERKKIILSFDEINKVAGKNIDRQLISNILLLLGMEVHANKEEQLMVTIPLNKTDVTRPVDLIEEILRIYGYNNIEIPETMTYQLSVDNNDSNPDYQKMISQYLADNGFFEIMNNSLTKKAYSHSFDFIDENRTVAIMNPLSNELNVLRQSLLFAGLENIARNINNKNPNLKLFEFGNCYHKNIEALKEEDVPKRFVENPVLSMYVTGTSGNDNWNQPAKEMDFFFLKNYIHNLFLILNFPAQQLTTSIDYSGLFMENLCYSLGENQILRMGKIHPRVLKYFDVKKPVYYAELYLDMLFPNCLNSAIEYRQLALAPEVKRDLALVIDKDVSYEKLKSVAIKSGSKLLKKIQLFDVYEGDKIELGKKSYALQFVLQHNEKTLTEEEINKVMDKLIAAFQKETGARLR
jgi:phenylalanyl-tRNA synthetase beta chain